MLPQSPAFKQFTVALEFVGKDTVRRSLWEIDFLLFDHHEKGSQFVQRFPDKLCHLRKWTTTKNLIPYHKSGSGGNGLPIVGSDVPPGGSHTDILVKDKYVP